MLDGWSQGGSLYVGPPLIEIDGSGADVPCTDGLVVTGDGAEVRGLAIGGFSNRGVELIANFTADAAPFTLRGTYLGTDATGNTANPNGGSGFYNDDSHNLIIGGPDASDGNVIAGNLGNGIHLDPSANVTIRGNAIGVGADGATPLGNAGAGILFDSCCDVGSSTVVDNVVANNGGAGVADVVDDGFVTISGNSIHDNGGLGIDLGDDGVTSNDLGDGPNFPPDADSGPNGLQNFPVVDSAVKVTGGRVRIDYSLTSTSGTTYTVEFFASPDKDDPTGYGEGARYLGSDTISLDGSFASGSVTLTPSAPVAAGEWISATATDSAGNTSEFSQSLARRRRAVGPFTVNTNADPAVGVGDGICTEADCTLREAIDAANASAADAESPAVINFGISGGDTQIALQGRPLPPITQPVVINGTNFGEGADVTDQRRRGRGSGQRARARGRLGKLDDPASLDPRLRRRWHSSHLECQPHRVQSGSHEQRRHRRRGRLGQRRRR